MRNAETTLAIIQERGSKGLPLEDVYRRLYNPDLYLKAYGNIYGNAGALTKGTTEETADGMSMERIYGIIELLKSEKFKWSPVRRVFIPKKNGKTRPLGIPNFSPDRLLQEVMRSILEAYYEPQFSPNSHGFRPEKGCHTALKDIFHAWTGTKWFVEGDIKGCFDNIDHSKLLEILSENHHDNRFLRLVDNLLKAGYMERWDRRPTLSGTPQGGIISPILANIYLDRLDKFVETVLIPEYTRGETKRYNPTWSRLKFQIKVLTRKGAPRSTIDRLKREKAKTPSRMQFDGKYRRLRYVRYADDFLLGFDGPKAEAEEIRDRLAQFLRDNLKLELSPEKTLITHASTQKARFLGYDISTVNTKALNAAICLRIPGQVIEDKCQRYKNGGKPTHRRELVNDTDFSIIARYGSEYRGFVQYYVFARNRFWLQKLHWVMEYSLLKTLANKHKTTVRKVYRRYKAKAITKFGTVARCLRAVIERNGKDPLTAQFGGISLRPEPFAVIDDYIPDQDRYGTNNRNELSKRLLADWCEVCGSRDRIVVHHVRGLKDLKVQGQRTPALWKQIMASRRRKTLVVCTPCHVAIHNGNPLPATKPYGLDLPESRVR